MRRLTDWDIASKALFSRLLVTLLQILFNNTIPDHAADAFHQKPLDFPGIGDRIVESALGGFRKWDGAYFAHLAEDGYTQAHMFAFFPIFPITIRLLTDTALYPLQAMMHLRSVLLIAGWLTNAIGFALAAVGLYKLTRSVLKDERLAFISSILFCFNPASVFMSALYTETLFSMFCLYGMFFLEKGKYVMSAIAFSLSTGTRSNGLVTLGFVTYISVQSVFLSLTSMHRGDAFVKLKIIAVKFVSSVTWILCSSAIILFPFLLFQVYAFLTICRPESAISLSLIFECCMDRVFYLVNLRGVDKPDNRREYDKLVPQWCKGTFPIPYSHIQAEHWDVGFMRYYDVKQIPNFLLASPVVILCIYGAWTYYKANWSYVQCLGLQQPIGGDVKKSDEPTTQSEGFFNHQAFVYWAHLMALLIFGVCCMHIQVVTRFLVSSSPAVVWTAAHIIQTSLTEGRKESPSHHQKRTCQEMEPMDIVWRAKLNWKGRLVRGYFLGYTLIGVVMHCNFLPWT